MRYHYIPPKIYLSLYGQTYKCNHPVYSSCTLYLLEGRGLAVIQQRFRPEDKSTYWSEIDPWLVDDIYLKQGFLAFFEKYAAEKDESDLYPTVTVRQLMWKLRFKPLPKREWETVFDKSPI